MRMLNSTSSFRSHTVQVSALAPVSLGLDKTTDKTTPSFIVKLISHVFTALQFTPKTNTQTRYNSWRRTAAQNASLRGRKLLACRRGRRLCTAPYISRNFCSPHCVASSSACVNDVVSVAIIGHGIRHGCPFQAHRGRRFCAAQLLRCDPAAERSAHRSVRLARHGRLAESRCHCVRRVRSPDDLRTAA